MCFGLFREAHTSPNEWLIQFIFWSPIIWLYQFPCYWVAGYLWKGTTTKKNVIFFLTYIGMGFLFATVLSYITFLLGSPPKNYYLRLYFFSFLFSILFWWTSIKNNFKLKMK
jgi:hypothetical protein